VLTFIKVLLAGIFILVGGAFAVANNQPATIELYFSTPTLPLSLLLLFAVGVGIVLGAIASSFFYMRIKKENADLRRQSRLVEQEVKNLRTLPLSGR